MHGIVRITRPPLGDLIGKEWQICQLGAVLRSCGPANAAPEWQVGSLGWWSRDLVGACPLEGIVMPSYQIVGEID